MKSQFDDYFQEISAKYSREQTSEMGYRTEFEILLKNIFESTGVIDIDHDARARQGNKPDFAILKNNIPILYIEVKDIGVDLNKVEKSEQMIRYYGYANLVLTDYLEFRFYRNGEKYGDSIIIGEYNKNSRKLDSFPDKYEYLAQTLKDFAASHKEPIKSGKHLSKIMGGKAQRIRDNVRQFLITPSDKNTELIHVYATIKKLLVHDLTTEAFADMYAQTLVYGLFVARYYDETKKDFSRQEARDLIPKSNPLLQHFFDHIVGPNFDKRLEYIVNELCEVFSHADVQELMREYFKDDLWGKTQKGPDPVIHFYEDFLQEYDADLRKKMGAYYTPLPVVQFIVRSVDYLLEKEFNLTGGLADTSKTTEGIHRVQILDPAVGTGTFISDVIGKIYSRILKRKQEGSWSTYVHNDLLPRLHGFELMMTPYTITHLKLGIAFKKTGFKYFNQRLGIYLTNSLEGGSIQDDIFTGFGFAESIAEESKEASKIKNDKPIMIVVGNPPYSISSSNKGDWILNLIKDYKKDLNERKINLDDDYIKFIRFAEHFIEKNKTGIVAMITNNSFIDGITHRQMRKHLLETFDDIYILDLHGNSKKKEKAPDGSKDENVFNIMQGVSINIFVRKNEDKEGLGNVYHSELWGKREAKFGALNDYDLDKIKRQKLDYSEPYYFFIPKDFGLDEEYKNGFRLDELFQEYNSGIQTKRDSIAVSYDKHNLEETTDYFRSNKPDDIRHKFSLPADGRDWSIRDAKKDLDIGDGKIIDYYYKPFDTRKTYFSGRTKGFIAYPRIKTAKNFLNENVGMCLMRTQVNSKDFSTILVTNAYADINFYGFQTYVFPLYIYDDDIQILNLKPEIVAEVGKIVEKVSGENIFDYIYAVLHSPTYREKYKDFLKIDFPRVPYPRDKKQFESLVDLGKELREIHLLESKKLDVPITTYSVQEGTDEVEKIIYKNNKVYINKDKYFGAVPEIAWNFYIGGYQPAQKWLKDRKGRKLTNSDIEHYQKIIVALVETDIIMKEIDKVI